MSNEEIIKIVMRLILSDSVSWARPEQISTRLIGLKRDDELGWILEPIVEKCDKSRKYSTVIELPEWLWFEPDNYKFLLGVAMYLSEKLTLASRAIKSAENRSKATRAAIGKAGAEARWKKPVDFEPRP